MAKGVNPKWLQGLKWRGNEARVVEKDGRKTTAYTPVERELTADDVLSFREDGAEVVLVTSDGQKVRVPRGGAGKGAE